jgi:flagellar protein FlaG
MTILPPDRAPPADPLASALAGAGPASAATSVAAAVAAPQSRADVERAVVRANVQMAEVAPSLQFEVDPDTHHVVIRLVDRHDQRVLRQVPAPEMLEIARALDRMQSLLVRGKA